MTYEVRVDDNFNRGDHYSHSTHDSAAAAIAVCKRIVDDFLHLQMKDAPVLTPLELYAQYKRFGDDPFIVTTDATCRFSAWEYAAERCRELIPEGDTGRSD